MNKIYFNIPYTLQSSFNNIADLLSKPELINNGRNLELCKQWFEKQYPGYSAFMTTSCTRALELIFQSQKWTNDDEIILSPYNYVGVANAIISTGAIPIFADIDPYSMNLNPKEVLKKINKNTKAIIAMHYAAIPNNILELRNIADSHNLILIEDNAQGITNKYNGNLLGSFGNFSCISFDTLKNISCHEGGVLLCKEKYKDAVEISFENGTNRIAFLKGESNNYSWIAKGSKYSLSEYNAAILLPLLYQSESIIAQRKSIWDQFYKLLYSNITIKPYLPKILQEEEHNGHLLYIKLRDNKHRQDCISYLKKYDIPAYFHYSTLHNTVMGAMKDTDCINAINESNKLLRLPMHHLLEVEQMEYIVSKLCEFLKNND